MDENGAGGRSDYREFVFTATGKDTEVGSFSSIDLHDNLAMELERLGSLAELLICAEGRVNPDALGGVGLLVRDVHARMRAVLEAARAGEGEGGARQEAGGRAVEK